MRPESVDRVLPAMECIDGCGDWIFRSDIDSAEDLLARLAELADDENIPFSWEEAEFAASEISKQRG